VNTVEKIIISYPCRELMYTSSTMGTWVRHRLVNDVDRYVIIRKLLDSIFNTLPILIRRWKTKTYCTYKGIFFRKVA
jgi:hypothetical protein